MRRYLSEAFWARPSLAGVGRVPWNALCVAGAAILGSGEHAIWLAAAGLETIYLYALVTNVRFQHWVDAKRLQEMQSGRSRTPAAAPMLDETQRRRVSELERKCATIEQLYRDAHEEDFLYDANRDALRKLTSLYARLLVAQRNLQSLDVTSRDADLRTSISAIEAELRDGSMSGGLRDSKTATLAILNQRLRNLHRRNESLAEIESDLTRIEQQIDLAVEDASLKGRPTAISADIDLVSYLLDGSEEPFPPSPANPTPETTAPSASRGEVEN